MKEITISSKGLTLKDNQILDFFEKEVTPHGTGGKIPCSSKYIGKKAYVIITDEKAPKVSKKIQDDFKDILKYSEQSLKEVWDNPEDDIWNTYLR